jgi:hypothetical protein
VSEPTPPGCASDPTLEMLWTTVPAYTGATAPSGGKILAAPPPAATLVPIAVNLGTVQAAESAMLSAIAQVVSAYNQQNQAVQSEIAEGTIFGQQAEYTALQVHAEQLRVSRPRWERAALGTADRTAAVRAGIRRSDQPGDDPGSADDRGRG